MGRTFRMSPAMAAGVTNLERRGLGCPLGSLRASEGGKSSVNDRLDCDRFAARNGLLPLESSTGLSPHLRAIGDSPQVRPTNKMSSDGNRSEMEAPPDLLQIVEGDWWRRVDSNHGPTDYETVALAT
jgi:hypothetical protein